MKRLIYVNSNHDHGRYVEEAVVSAESFRSFIPDCEVVLYTDRTGFRHPVFDQIIPAEFSVPPALEGKDHKNGQMVVKHRAMLESPAQHNLVLGSDTLALHERVNSPFELLARFDLAAAHAPTRICAPVPDVPDAWPEFNCDVIYFRRNDRSRSFFEEWSRSYRENVIDHPHDQGSFRYLTYHSGVRIAALPFEYNDRMGMFGAQARSGDRRRITPVIVQNREVIREMLTGRTDLTTLLRAGTPRRERRRRTAFRLVKALLRRADG